MTQPSTETIATPAAAPAMPSLDERVAAVNKEMDDAFAASGIVPVPEDQIPSAADVLKEAFGADGAAVIPAAAAVTPAAPDAEAAARAAERRARLDALGAKTRDQVDRKAALAAQDKMVRDLAAAEARAKAAEEAAAAGANRIDVDALDAAGFFALAERTKVKPEDLQAWLHKAVTSPEKIAEAAALKAASSTYDPKLAALEARIAKQDAALEALRAENASHASRAEEQRQTQAFLGMVSQSAERAPLASRLLAADHDEFMQMATLAAERVPGQGPDALLDALEELLDKDVRKASSTWTSIYAPTPSQPTAPVTTPPTRGAALPKTVSNSLAQSRTALVEDQDFSKLTLEERAAILRRS